MLEVEEKFVNEGKQLLTNIRVGTDRIAQDRQESETIEKSRLGLKSAIG